MNAPTKKELQSFLEYFTSRGFRHVLRARTKNTSKDKTQTTYIALEEGTKSVMVLRPRTMNMQDAKEKANEMREKLGPSYEVIISSEALEIEVFDLITLDFVEDLPEIL